MTDVIAPPDAPAADAANPSVAPAAPDTSASENHRVRFSMRAKMLLAFVSVFTVIFALLGVLTVNEVVGQAEKQLKKQNRETAIGAAKLISGDEMLQLQQDIPVGVPSKDFPKNFPVDNPLYRKLCQQLVDLRTAVPNASPYTFFQDPKTKKLLWETTYVYDPPEDWAAPFRGDVTELVGPETGLTYQLMLKSVNQVVDQPPYSESSGKRWESTYAPIKDSKGNNVAVLGVDFAMDYVEQVRNEAIKGILPILILSYAVLIIMVLVLATWLTRPLKRLTIASRRIADGDYETEMDRPSTSRFADEMSVLSSTFALMVEKVRIRERNLASQVRRLTVQIDSKKREQSVAELTESDFFSGIVEKGKALREGFVAEVKPGESADAPKDSES
jgi:HAMP domain-containing protein